MISQSRYYNQIMIYFLSNCLRFLIKVLKQPISQMNQKMQISPQFIKKTIDTKKRIIDLLVLYLLYPKYSNVVFLIKSIKALKIHCLDIKWVTERDIALNIF